jgi:hypothetical protein
MICLGEKFGHFVKDDILAYVLKLEISYRVIINILKDLFRFLLEDFLKIYYIYLDGEIFEFSIILLNLP